MAKNLYVPITLSNINRFSKFFTNGISRKCVVTLTLKVPSHLIGVVTLPCEVSDVALKPVTTVTNCVIKTLLKPDMWLPNSLNLNLVNYAVWEVLFHRYFNNVANSRQFWSTEWGKLSQRLVNRAIGQWRRWLECIVQQQS